SSTIRILHFSQLCWLYGIYPHAAQDLEYRYESISKPKTRKQQNFRDPYADCLPCDDTNICLSLPQSPIKPLFPPVSSGHNALLASDLKAVVGQDFYLDCVTCSNDVPRCGVGWPLFIIPKDRFKDFAIVQLNADSYLFYGLRIRSLMNKS